MLGWDIVNSHLIAERIGHPITVYENYGVRLWVDVGTDVLTLNLHLNYKRNYIVLLFRCILSRQALPSL